MEQQGVDPEWKRDQLDRMYKSVLEERAKRSKRSKLFDRMYNFLMRIL